MDFSNKELYAIIKGKKSVSGNPYPEDYEEYLKAREADLKWVIDEADARTKFHELRAEDLRNQHHPIKAYIEERKADNLRGVSNNTFDKYWDTQDKRELLTQMRKDSEKAQADNEAWANERGKTFTPEGELAPLETPEESKEETSKEETSDQSAFDALI